jgi:hypothetical protein
METSRNAVPRNETFTIGGGAVRKRIGRLARLLVMEAPHRTVRRAQGPHAYAVAVL